MADLETFRRETREWLTKHAPSQIAGIASNDLEGNWGGKKATYAVPEMKTWLEVMAARGWTAPSWPQEYGGGGLSGAEAKVLAQEMAKLRLPAPLIGFGLTMIGPTLLQFGTEEQKREHLPKICRGEIRWCQGYSEPDAGSDLASLKTRAIRDGDHFVVTGTKVWTSYADKADWIFALVRSNPQAKKQEGITFLLVDMSTPGVSVRPILLISGKSPFCETHFENVRVPISNVVHKIDAGWTVAKALLGHERSMIADAFGGGQGGGQKTSRGSALVRLAREHLGDGAGRIPDPILRDQIAQEELDTRAFALTVQRAKDGAKAGHRPGPESSIFKVYATELNMRRHELMVKAMGPAGLGWEGPGFDEGDLEVTRDWLRSRGNSIEGGTSEVQLNIIAKRVLGLPD
ncbi:MAG TPA: acyl-CoA dehydrogenase family protein [Myxococcota bacterium]|jgi:alkylation response protein AidB-like acyl-CoA dehydrogenase|nr:acyl-CoA dehydrogenase family protein [Myxococcota bacterium]